MDEMAKFDRIMLSFYRNRYEDVQKTNRMLWDFLIEVLNKIDGPLSPTELKTTADRITDQLKSMLERGVGM